MGRSAGQSRWRRYYGDQGCHGKGETGDNSD
jgi:hypothetical protein